MGKEGDDKMKQPLQEFADNMEISYKVHDEVTGEITEKGVKKTRSNIFQPVLEENESWFRVWLRRRLINMTTRLTRWTNLTYTMHNRFWWIHFVWKERIMHPMLKFLQWFMKKSMVHEDKDIHPGWYNNHIRIGFYCWEKGIEAMRKLMIYHQTASVRKAKGEKPVHETAQKYWEHCKNMKSTKNMLVVRDMMYSFLLEDTAYREWYNFNILIQTHEMMMLYGVSTEEAKKVPLPGQYPIYFAGGPHNPEYFQSNVLVPEWKHPEQREKEEKKNATSKRK